MSMKGSVTTADYLPYADYQKLVQTLINEKKVLVGLLLHPVFLYGIAFF